MFITQINDNNTPPYWWSENVFHAEFLEYKVDNFCDQIARIYNQHFPG